MVVDFQHHFAPREIFKEDLGDRRILTFDANGAPSYTSHRLLYDLDEHVRMMDLAGIDAALLTAGPGMIADLERSRLVNDAAEKAARDYPGRFIGCAHVDPLGGEEHLRELARCADRGFPGVVICSEQNGLFLDDPAFDPFWREAARLGLFVFVHPALKLNFSQQFDIFDTARSVGREFSLQMAVIRLINGRVFDKHPELTIHMAHLGGGIAAVLGRVRSYQDKEFWGTTGNARHGVLPEHDLDWYLNHRMVFDTAGFCGEIKSVKTALVEIPAARIVFATDYPQEIRDASVVKRFVDDLHALGDDGRRILDDNAALLLGDRARPTAATR